MGHTPERLSANSSSLSGSAIGLSIPALAAAPAPGLHRVAAYFLLHTHVDLGKQGLQSV